ncbi:SDR family oxidoreductase [Planosporangium mesophilum]|uniref:NAD-dependent dehydratase n=1 Tax=Planosporangium mesophilum TaxID=689768 RepID=A0A8J3X607_9ACTN|nr:SDR family oxidoreductase [Planosporangium mesophilum]NJC81986.1 SDR family oxidoreductase [Planosporangium mesophilum]GII25248.1 NAD-dependent dehydratase [Planosporangium mesophilum]
MRVVIAGGHGQIALRLARLLADRGDTPVGLVRNEDHFGDVRAAGAEPVLRDLEEATDAEVAEVVAGADAVVFAAGAGPGSGVTRKDTMDRAGAALLADAVQHARVRRYLLVSSMGADRADRPDTDPVFAAYLRAKAASEEDLRRRDLDWTILRPGRLTNEAGTGRVRLAGSVPAGAVPRDDVAAVLLALLDRPESRNLTLELVGGDTPVDEAVTRLAA